MLPINSIWKRYFTNHNEGFGTTYERFILHQYFERIRSEFSIKRVLEAPCFGMTGISGINSMWWAIEGCSVTIADHAKERIDLIKKVWRKLSLDLNFIYVRNLSEYARLPFEDNVFDMGWNFAALWFVPDLSDFLKELTRVNRKVVFICVPNSSNIFQISRMVSQKTSDALYAENINPSKIAEIMAGLDWQVEEHGYLDIPPWPDIAMSKEDFLQKIGLKRLSTMLKNKDQNYVSILDYFSGKKKGMEEDILKYGFLENLPPFISKFWAHHQYFLFTPMKK